MSPNVAIFVAWTHSLCLCGTCIVLQKDQNCCRRGHIVCVFLVKGSVLAANCVQGGAAVCPVGLHHQWVECDCSIKLLSSVFVMSGNVRCLIGSWFAFPFYSGDLFWLLFTFSAFSSLLILIPTHSALSSFTFFSSLLSCPFLSSALLSSFLFSSLLFSSSSSYWDFSQLESFLPFSCDNAPYLSQH